MRRAFEAGGDPSPKSMLVSEDADLSVLDLTYPVIVKPTDRSGSRGIFKVECADDLVPAVSAAAASGFEKKVLIQQRHSSTELPFERGDIYDANGKLFVEGDCWLGGMVFEDGSVELQGDIKGNWTTYPEAEFTFSGSEKQIIAPNTKTVT